jgi:hypothetical protein
VALWIDVIREEREGVRVEVIVWAALVAESCGKRVSTRVCISSSSSSSLLVGLK